MVSALVTGTRFTPSRLESGSANKRSARFSLAGLGRLATNGIGFMTSRSVQQPLPPMEVNSLESREVARERTPKELESLPAPRPLDMAKAAIGRAIKHGIGDDPLKVYGNEGQMSNVIAGPQVPDYMARIFLNPEARRRYALSLLRGDKQVRVRTIVEIDEEAV